MGGYEEYLREQVGDRWFRYNPRLTCIYCCKSFNQKGSLDRHMRLHMGITPFVCRICGKKYTRKDQLEYHIRKHTGNKPFPLPRLQQELPVPGNPQSALPQEPSRLRPTGGVPQCLARDYHGHLPWRPKRRRVTLPGGCRGQWWRGRCWLILRRSGPTFGIHHWARLKGFKGTRYKFKETQDSGDLLLRVPSVPCLPPSTLKLQVVKSWVSRRFSQLLSTRNG